MGVCSEKCVLLSKKVRLFSQNDVLFLFYFLINPAGTTVNIKGKKNFRFHFRSNIKELTRMCFY